MGREIRHRLTPVAGALVASLAALSGCGGADGACGSDVCLFPTVRKPVSLTLRLAPHVITAGDTVDVACIAKYDDGATAYLDVSDETIAISPDPGPNAVGEGTLSLLRSGTYDVTCRYEGVVSEADTVLVEAGEPVRSTVTLDRTTIASRESTTARCKVEDRLGNEVPGLATTVASDPRQGLVITDATIVAERAGEYAISCSVARAIVERVPATLTVVPGAPVRVEALLSDWGVRAGEPVGVTCFVADAFGNQVEVATSFAVDPAPAITDAMGFTATRAGSYGVTCEVPSASLVSDEAYAQVYAGLPARLEIVRFEPTLPAYGRGDTIEVGVVMTDVFGNENTTAAWEITSSPPDATSFAGLHRVTLSGNGLVDVIARVTSETEGGAEVSDSVTVLVDTTAPEIVIDWPARGEIVTGTPGAPITVRGHVVEVGAGLTSLVLAGQTITVDRTGAFTFSLPTEWGINLIEGTASDGAGNRRELAQSFELASRYRQASPARVQSGKITSGVVVRLGQAVLDDNASDVDDLATIARLAIQQLDLTSLLPNPVTTYNSDCSVLFVTIRGALNLHVDAIRHGTPIIDLTAINGGLHLRAEIPNLSVDVHTSGDVCDIGVGVSGNASVTRAVIEGDLTISRSGGTFNVAMPNASVTLSGLRIDLDLPSIIDWAVDGIISLFTGMIADALEDALRDAIRDQIPPVVRDFLASLSLGTGFDLPDPLNLHVDLASSLGSVDFRTGGGTIGFDTTIYTTGTIVPEPVGGILQESSVPPSFDASRPLGAALAFDLLNQALYSAWYGGALDLDLSSFLPPQSGSVTLEASAQGLLPPVIAPSGDPSWPIELQVGDLQLDVVVSGLADLPEIALTIYATAYAPASVSVTAAGELAFAIGPQPRLALDLSGGVDGLVDANVIAPQLAATIEHLLPVLLNQALQGIPIPSFDLSSMAGGYLPPGIVLGLGNVQSSVQSSYLVLEGVVVPQ
ncbi:hypothetical protein L6R52_04015 [Myxococcota bacterium]|nr:hypothetical protein [Myxococcota bacterium]